MENLHALSAITLQRDQYFARTMEEQIKNFYNKKCKHNIKSKFPSQPIQHTKRKPLQTHERVSLSKGQS